MKKITFILYSALFSLTAFSAQNKKVKVSNPFSIRNVGLNFNFQIDQENVPEGQEVALTNSLKTQLRLIYPGNNGDSPYNLVASKNLTKDQLDVLRELRGRFEAHLLFLFSQWLELDTHKEDFFHGVVFKNLEKVKKLSENFCQFIEENVGPSYSLSSKGSGNPFRDLENFISKNINKIDPELFNFSNFESIGDSTEWLIILEEKIFKDYYKEKKQWVYPESIVCQLSTFFMPAIEAFDRKRIWRNVWVSIAWQDMYNPLNNNLFATSERPDIESILQSLPDDKDTPSPLFFLHLMRKSVDFTSVVNILRNGNFNDLLPHSLLFNTLSKACLKASHSDFYINKEKCLKAYKEDMFWFEIDTSEVLTHIPPKTHSLLAL